MLTKTIRLAVVGVSHRNNDRKSRQAIIRQVEVGDQLDLVREPANLYDSNAIMVRHALGQIGYIDKASARTLAPMMDAGETFEVRVAAVFNRNRRRHHFAGVRMDITYSTE